MNGRLHWRHLTRQADWDSIAPCSAREAEWVMAARAESRAAARSWRESRRAVEESLKEVAAAAETRAVIDANASLRAAGVAWLAARRSLDAVTAAGGPITRWQQRRRRVADERLAATIEAMVALGQAAVVRSLSTCTRHASSRLASRRLAISCG